MICTRYQNIIVENSGSRYQIFPLNNLSCFVSPLGIVGGGLRRLEATAVTPVQVEPLGHRSVPTESYHVATPPPGISG